MEKDQKLCTAQASLGLCMDGGTWEQAQKSFAKQSREECAAFIVRTTLLLQEEEEQAAGEGGGATAGLT